MSRFAVVTGAARRVGRATAIALAERGFNLALTRHLRAEELQQTAQDSVAAARRAGHAISVRQDALDLAEPGAVERYARSFDTPVDVLVHNASRYRAGVVGAITAQDALADYQVNALAPLLLTQGLCAQLQKSDLPGGALVAALGDIHAEGRPLPGFASYLMSKAALHQLVQVLAVAMAPRVRVNGLLFGVVAWPDDTDPELIKRYEARIPLERPGTPDDAARAVCALALELPYATGALLRLDGGRWLR